MPHRTCHLFAVAAFLLALAGCGRKAEPGPRPDPQEDAGWQPDATLLDELAPAEDVAGYQIRPPKGFAKSGPDKPIAGVKAIPFWFGTARADEPAPQLKVQVSTVPAEMAPPLEEALSGQLSLPKQQLERWSQLEPERGKVNGLDFLRVRWSGTDPRTKAKTSGFTYVAQDGENSVTLSGQATGPEQENALKLAEAAVLTFKKK
jgi:hypothetical protein